MKNQTITTSLNFTSDVSDAISGLKKLREQMGNLTTDQSIFGNVDKEFEKVQKAMRDLAAKKEFAGTSKGAAEYKKILDSITVSANKIGQELTQIGTNANGAFKFKNVEQAQRVLAGLESNLKLVNKGLKDAQKELSTGLKNLGINEITAKTLQGEQAVTEELRKQYELRKQNYENLVASQRAGIASKLSNSVRKINTTSIVDPGTDKFKGTAADTVQASIQTALAEGIKQSQTWEQVQLKILEDLNKSQIVVQNIDKLLEPIKNDFQEAALKAGSEADNVKKAREEMEALGRIGANGALQFSQGAQSAINLANSVDRARQSQTDLKGQIDAAKQSIQQEGQTGQQSLNQITAGTEQAVQQTKNFINAEHQSTDAIREQNKEQERLDSTMSRMQMWITNILSIGNAWRKFTQIIRQTFNDVQKLDKAFASIAMVTDKTVEGLWATYDQYADMANRLGQSTESAIKASALFYQQGLDTADALRLTEDTMKLATLAGADFETATQQMTAALRGFHMEMDQGAHVTDVYSELAAHAAADVNGIAYAMSKTASIASSAGMSFETTAAFLTNMIETTQEAPENIGTAMKTIIARFTELKENVSAADSEFDDLDYNKVDKALKSIGIQLKDAQGQFRNLDDVFLELSQKWDSLDRNTQRYIATIAAGSRQQSRFIAMMEDYDRTMELVETAQDSAGRSSQQFAKYQDTVEYKLNQLKNAWEQLRVTMVDSDIFKGAIDSITNFTKKISKLDFKKLIVMAPIVIPMVKQFINTFISGVKTSASNFQEIGKIVGNSIGSGISNIITKVTNKNLWSTILQKDNLQQESTGVQNKLQEVQNKLESLRNSEMTAGPIMKGTIDSMRDYAEHGIPLAIEAVNEYEQKEAELIEQEKALIQEQDQLKQKLDEVSAAEQKQAQNAKIWGQGMSKALNSIGSAAVMATSALISGADATDVLKTLTISLGISAAQMALQWASASIAAKAGGQVQVAETIKAETEKTTAVAAGSAARVALVEGEAIATGQAIGTGIDVGLASTGVGAIIVAIAAAVAGITLGIITLVKKAKEENKSLDEQLEDAKSKLEEIESTESEKKSKASEEKEKLQNTESLISRYDELSKKLVKTTEEQEEWKNLIADINDQFPEIVSSYDEANGKITIQRDLWQDIVDLQKEAAKDAAQESTIATATSIGLKRRVASLNYQNNVSSTDFSKQRENLNFVAYTGEQAREYIKNAGLDNQLIQSSFGVNLASLNDDEILKFYEDLQNENSAGWKKVELAIEEINSRAAESYQKQMDYYDELEKANISSYLQASGESKNISDFIAIGANNYKGKNVDQYNLKTKAEGHLNVFTPGWDNDFEEWEKLSSDQKAILKSMGYENKKAWEDVRKNLADDKDFAIEYAEAAYTYNAERLADAMNENLDEATKGMIEDYMFNYSSMTSEEITTLESQIKDEIEKIADDDAKNAINNSLKKYIDQKNSEREKLVVQLQTSIANEGKDFTNWTIDQLNAYNTLVQNAIDQLGVKVGQDYINGLEDIFDGIDPDTFASALNTINWSAASGLNWEEFRESSIEQLEEIGIDGAEAFFDKWSEYEQKFGNLTLSITGEEEVTEYLEKIEETVDKINSSRSDIAELNAKLNSGLSLDFDDFQKYSKMIEEMGLAVEDYLKIDDSGNIIANAEKINTLFKDAYQQQIESVEKQRDLLDEELDIRLDQLKTQHQDNLAEINKNEYIQEQIGNENELLAIEYERLSLKAKEEHNYALANDYARQTWETRRKGLATEEEIRKKREELIDEENKRNDEAVKAAQQSRVDAEKRFNEEIDKLKKEALAAGKAYDKEYTEDMKKNADEMIEKTKEIEDATDKVADAWEKVADAQEKVNEALEKIKEKEQDVIDKTEELNKILYGDQYHKNKLDAMYNYSTALDAITTKTSRAKSSLESYNGKEDVSALMQTYMQGTHAEVVSRSAQNEVIAASIRNYEQVLSSKLASEISSMNAAHGSHMSTNISDYVYKNGDVTAVNFQALNAAQLPDEISNYVEECVETINNLQKQIDDNTEAIKQKEKEIRDMRKNALQRRINLEKEVADVLKKQAEDEVKTQKDKYDALKDADDDYLNALEQAINKERELRERNKEWDDLATKEKKLSLMQRDTSGANAKEVMSLEQDVQDTRENLLDKTIDDIIKSMKEMYELQQESREKELEYQEAMIESTEWIKQATAIIDGWTTSDDMVTWFIQNATEEYTDGSAAVQEYMRMSWEDTGNQMVADSEILSQDMSDLAIATHEEISQTVIETSETLTEQADFSLQSIVASAEDAITKGEQALEDAIREVQNARDDYREAIKELEEAEAAARQAEEDARKAQQDAEEQRAAATNGAWIPWSNDNSSTTPSSKQSVKFSGNTTLNHNAIDDMARQINAGILNIDDANQYLKAYGGSFHYKKGGIVDYTGPAWVDGTPNEPEAFLSAEDTKRIGAAAELLASLPFFSGGSINNSVNNGDSLIEVHINIENISSDVDLDDALDKMKNAIWEAANPAGSSVILSK